MLAHFLIGVLCTCFVFAENVSNSTSENDLEESDVYYPSADWSDTFDWKLLKVFSTPEFKNVLISPIGLKLILALLYEGSGGYTEREFQQVLQFPVQKQALRDQYSQILDDLQPSERKQYILNLGTRVFLDSQITPQQNFAAKASHHYNTDIEPTNFSQPIEASKTINSWIDKLTNGKVPQLVSPGDLQDAIMIIGNAIYFKGTWRHQFPKNQTKNGGFYVTPTEVINVPYMTTTDKFYYFESNDLDAKILRLPYKGNHYALFIVLPNSKAGLPNLLKKISLHSLKQQLYLMDHVPVEVSIPKFKFNFQARYTNILKSFGLQQMFQNSASFPGIARGVPHLLRMLVVSDIIQKTGIELDEEGSVVYSATEIQVGNKFGEADNTFNASHPFLFFIEEQNRGTILFVGKVENPLDAYPVPLPSRFSDSDTPPSEAQPQPLGNIPNLQPVNPQRNALLRRFNYFDLELLKEFSDYQGNVFISPASIKTTLALILEGAKGRSAHEIESALRIENIDEREIRTILSKLLFDLNDRSPNTLLEAASSIFVSDKYMNKVLPDYEKRISNYYGASVKSLDFTRPSEAAKVINSWGYNTTHGVIKEIVNEHAIAGDTSMVLANALFFKGKWKTAFDTKNTKIKCFKSITRPCIHTPLMQVADTFNYNFIVELNAHAIELPYQDDKYAMLILLPANGNNIKILARDMQHAVFNDILDQLRPSDIILEIPKFEIEFNTELVPYLTPLKILEVFGPRANLSGIFSKGNVKINSILHKSRVEVNEQGTRAAAATSAIVIPLMGTTAQRVIADHPFIFFIYHRESKNIIFEGILAEPVDVGVSPQPLLKTAQSQYYPQQRIRQYQQYNPVYQGSGNEDIFTYK